MHRNKSVVDRKSGTELKRVCRNASTSSRLDSGDIGACCTCVSGSTGGNITLSSLPFMQFPGVPDPIPLSSCLLCAVNSLQFLLELLDSEVRRVVGSEGR